MALPENRARVACIISAYRLPAMLVRLVQRLEAPGWCTFVHVDARTGDDVYRAMTDPLADRDDVTFLPRHACHWGDFGHVRATLAGLGALIVSERPFDYVVLLTGQDYPIKPTDVIDATLARADGRIFMRAMPIPNEHWTDGGAYRYENRFFRIGSREFSFPGAPFPGRRLNAAWWRAARALGLYRSFPNGLRPFGGSSYWMLPADAARYVEERSRTDRSLVRFFRLVRIPDEIFFQTLIMNSPFRERLAEGDLRYVDWGEGGDSPRVLTCEDLPALAASDALFARKFDPDVDAEVLDRLDRIKAG